ncbi:MAG: AI-2E family transporter [Candidatus Saccharibacteria bacterium]|nr:AI-2E family transporter [Candidatus Saccharibacteria bacterium]
MSKIIEGDTNSYVKFWLVPLGIGLVLLFLYQALSGLIIIGLSIFLALALKPLVKMVDNFFTKIFGKNKKHQTASAVLAYLIVVVVIGGILAIIGPVVVNETTKFIQQAPEMFEKTLGGWEGINNFGKAIGIENLQNEISNALGTLSSSIFGTLGENVIASVGGFADVVMKLMLVLILTLLFLLEGPKLVATFWRSVSDGDENKHRVAESKKVVSKMAGVISTYVSRQITVAAIDGVASGLIVFVLSLFTGIESTLAIPMGMITMIFYMIPMFGQFIGGTLVTLILLFTSPLAAIIFAVIYIIYAQIENNIISPKIQGNALRLPAVTILCAVIIGMYMFGLLGAIIAIPIAGCIRVLIDEYPNIKAARRLD